MITIEQVLDTVNQLPFEQQEKLMEILINRLINHRRQEIARDALESIAAFENGELQPQPLEKIIAKLTVT
ncbi:MAG: hypothetical protein GDA44_02815 [Prochloron sp. SP5CPC1]|nr:hypothetical protein [Candidatus Paraprochloron terpiosi SP5CPC1]